MLVHLAFIILGGREETRAVNLTGSRNVFAARRAHVRRLVYTSSVAAYGFHADNPQPLTEDVQPRGSEALLLLGPEGRARAGARRGDRRRGRRGLRAAPVHRRRAGRAAAAAPAAAAAAARAARCRCCPTPASRSSSSTTTTSRRRSSPPRSATGRPAPTTSPATGTITLGDLARALGWLSVPVPRAARRRRGARRRLPLVPSIAQWINAGRVPVVMDTPARAARPRAGSRATARARRLRELVAA